MDRLKRDIGEERTPLVPALFQIFDRLVDQKLRRIEILRQAGRLAILEPGRVVIDRQIGFLLPVVGARRIERERTVEAMRRRQRALAMTEMPFAGHHGPVAGRAETTCNGDDVIGQPADIARLTAMFERRRFRQIADPRQMAVDAGHQHRARRRADRRGVEIGKERTPGRQRVDIRRFNLAAIGAEIAEADIVGKDQHKIGPRLLRLRPAGETRKNRNPGYCGNGYPLHWHPPRPQFFSSTACAIAGRLVRRLRPHPAARGQVRPRPRERPAHRPAPRPPRHAPPHRAPHIRDATRRGNAGDRG